MNTERISFRFQLSVPFNPHQPVMDESYEYDSSNDTLTVSRQYGDVKRDLKDAVEDSVELEDFLADRFPQGYTDAYVDNNLIGISYISFNPDKMSFEYEAFGHVLVEV